MAEKVIVFFNSSFKTKERCIGILERIILHIPRYRKVLFCFIDRMNFSSTGRAMNSAILHLLKAHDLHQTPFPQTRPS